MTDPCCYCDEDPCACSLDDIRERAAEAHWFSYSTELDGNLRDWYDRANTDFCIYRMLRMRYERLDKVIGISMRESPILGAVRQRGKSFTATLERGMKRAIERSGMLDGLDAIPSPVKFLGADELCDMYPERAYVASVRPVTRPWNFLHSHTGNRHERRKTAALERKRR